MIKRIGLNPSGSDAGPGEEESADSGDSISVRIGRAATIKVTPKWLPAIIATLGLGGTVLYQTGSPASAAESRLRAVETEQSGVRGALEKLERRFVVRELRQTREWMWQAEQAKDYSRVGSLRDEERALEAELRR